MPKISPLQPTDALRFLRLADLRQNRRTSRSKIYRDVQNGVFPPPVHLGPNTSAWPAHEIDAIDRARIAGDGDDKIKVLVKSLVAARRVAA
jgi:prophage regulatory protein